MFIGDEYSNIHGSTVRVVEILKGTRTASIKNIETGEIIIRNRDNIKTGNFKTSTCRTVYGVGYLGVGNFTCRDSNGILSEEYRIWSNMLRRCYTNYKSDKNITYINVEVCDEWHNFQNFADWYSRAVLKFKEYNIFPNIDKDLFSATGRGILYSPETCCILPSIINASLVEKRCTNGLHHGVITRRGKFIAMVMYKYKTYRVVCTTLEQAIKSYTILKKKVLCELAEEYKHVLEHQVYDKLIKWDIHKRKEKLYD